MKHIYFRKKLIMTSEKKAIRVIDDLELKAALDGFYVVGGRGEARVVYRHGSNKANGS